MEKILCPICSDPVQTFANLGNLRVHYTRAHIGLQLNDCQAKKLKRIFLPRAALNAGRFYGTLSESSSSSETESEDFGVVSPGTPSTQRKTNRRNQSDDSDAQQLRSIRNASSTSGDGDESLSTDDDQPLSQIASQNSRTKPSPRQNARHTRGISDISDNEEVQNESSATKTNQKRKQKENERCTNETATKRPRLLVLRESSDEELIDEIDEVNASNDGGLSEELNPRVVVTDLFQNESLVNKYLANTDQLTLESLGDVFEEDEPFGHEPLDGYTVEEQRSESNESFDERYEIEFLKVESIDIESEETAIESESSDVKSDEFVEMLIPEVILTTSDQPSLQCSSPNLTAIFEQVPVCFL